MYGTLALTPKALEDYRPIIGDAAADEIRRLAAPLRGLRVLNLSVTAFGTGVAELLNAAVPLLADAGVDCTWQVVRPAEEFAATNKALYRALAGLSDEWSSEQSETWLRYSQMNAELLSEPFDVIIVHDPQPAAIRSFAPDGGPRTRWVLHSHLDLSSAQPDAWALLRRHIEGYDAILFDAETFVHPDLRTVPITIVPPAIDPLGPRNMELSDETVRTILERYGIDPARPLLCQISPCDPSCDFLGCIDVLELVRRDVPGLQLALIAANPPEDPASIAYFDETVRKSMEYSDAHILRGVSEVGNVETNAFQRAAGVVIQKGLRRGFGLWVSDAQWKERPVVTTRSGGLVQQVVDGETGFLADSTEQFAQRVSQLLREPELASRLGQAGHLYVKERFLLPRFVADTLRVLTDVVRGGR
jgi:trehalose synthase